MGLTDKHLVYGDDIPQTQAEKDYYWALKNLKEKQQEPCEDINCISRQAVLDTLDKMDKALDDDRSVESYKALLTECYNDLPPVVPTPKEKTRWIPISEKEPESEGYGHYFLCCLENGIIRILGYSNILTTRCPKGFYYEKENGTTWRQDINPVVAWMPLPELYEPQESKVSE